MTTAAEKNELQRTGLYDPAHEHDACGVGFVAHIKGEKSHAIVQQGLKILENLDHRGAVGADKLMGDGAGGRIGQNDDIGQACTVQPLDRHGGLGHLHQAEDTLLHPRAAGSGADHIAALFLGRHQPRSMPDAAPGPVCPMSAVETS